MKLSASSKISCVEFIFIDVMTIFLNFFYRFNFIDVIEIIYRIHVFDCGRLPALLSSRPCRVVTLLPLSDVIPPLPCRHPPRIV